MKHGYLALLFLIVLPGFAQNQKKAALPPIPSGLYSWKTPAQQQTNELLATRIFEGSAFDMQYLEMSACALLPSKKRISQEVPADEEYLFMIKSGTLTISFGDSTWTLGPGSIALLMPNENYSVQNSTPGECRYYLMRYHSKTPVDLARGKSSGGSFVRDWNALPFKAHDRGGTRRYFDQSTAMCRRFEMHVTTLKSGLKSHDPHTHRAEEIILMLDDTGEEKSKTEMRIGEQYFKGGSGDLYFIRTNILHGIENNGTGTCSYFAFQFE